MALPAVPLFAQWVRIDSLTSGGFNAVHFINADTGFTFHEYGTLRKTTDGGETWDTVPTPMSSILFDFAFPTPQIGYAVGGAWFTGFEYYGNCIMRTDDGGLTWDSIQGNYNSGAYTSIAAVGEDEFFLTGSSQLIGTSDGGFSLDTIPVASHPMEACLRVKFVSATHGHLLTRQYLPNFTYLTRLYETTDGGETWDSVFADTATTSNYYSDFVFFDDNIGIIASNGGAQRTTNGGALWQQVVFPDAQAIVRIMEKSSSTTAYAATYHPNLLAGRLYRTDDMGLTWEMEPLQPDSFAEVADISFGTAGRGYVVTYNEVYRWSEPTGIYTADHSRGDIRVFPNPARDEVKLGLPQGMVADRIALRNVSGQLVKLVVVKTCGELDISVKGLPAGVYGLHVMNGGKVLGEASLVVSGD